MRAWRCVVLAALLASCDRPPPPPVPQPAVMEDLPLYDDVSIRKLAPFDIDAEWKRTRYLEMPCLDVVTGGETRPRLRVFAQLGLDERKMRRMSADPDGRVVFPRWQVSPSYDLVVMTGGEEEGGHPFDPDRSVYGVRLIPHAARWP